MSSGNINRMFVAGFKDIYRNPYIVESGRKFKYAYSVYSENERENAKRQLERQGLMHRIKEKTWHNKVYAWEIYISESK